MIDGSPRLATPDAEEVKSAARRFLEAGLCCAVETECGDDTPGCTGAWEPRLLLFPTATATKALGAVQDTVDRQPGARVRLAGYDPERLSRVALPAALICSLRPTPSPSQPRTSHRR